MQTVNVNFEGQNNEIMIVKLNRPHVMNALNLKAIEELTSIFQEESINEELRCVIITGVNDKVFCAGADLKERKNISNHEWRRQQDLIKDMIINIMEFPVPVIAAVEGYALAGGMEIALAADFIIGSQNAVFGLTEVTIGILPGAGGPQNLVRAIGKQRTKELIYTGRHINADLAYEWGIVNRVVPINKALDEAMNIAVNIANNAPLSIKMVKKTINKGGEVDFHTGYTLDLAYIDILMATEDRVEGINAFNEKRDPVWKNK